MTLSSFKQFNDLYKLSKTNLKKLGFQCKFADIIELNSRYRLARSFEGLKLSGYTESTLAGYDAFMQVFFSHSALERLLVVLGLKRTTQLANILSPQKSTPFITEFINEDKEKRLFQFLYEHLDNEKLKNHLQIIYEGKDHNIFQISASIRHIFAHGILTANANQIYPPRIKKMCTKLSNFTLDFIDSEFTKYVIELKENFSIN